jgi:serine/threonine protein kinase
MEEYRKYEPIFGSWYLSRQIGKGSFGKVYEITREEYGTTYRSALKIISIPQDEDDVKTILASGTEMESVTEYYKGILKEIVNENEIMAQLKGNSNIVSYEDHQIIRHEDVIGYDILIRMELLTPLLDRMMQKKLDEKEVVRLGIDMCKALELCHRKNIIHRDIKPQNIFISDNGDYKLGDFGIARTIEKTTGGMSKKGTDKYMAPEVYRGDNYDLTVDLYSLGIVLFSLLNGNRGPFLPAPPARVTHNDEEEARTRRMRG